MDLAKVRELAPEVIMLDILFAGECKDWPFITMARLDQQLCRIPTWARGLVAWCGLHEIGWIAVRQPEVLGPMSMRRQAGRDGNAGP